MNKFLIIFFLISNLASAQKLSKIDLLSTIADDICKEVNNDKVEIKSEFTMGVYMLKSVNKHREDITHYYGNDYFGDEGVMQTMGEDIGVYLALKCPEIFEHFVYEEEAEIFESIETKTVTGSIHKINDERFITFVVQEESGKKHEFILLYDFETAYLLTDKLVKVKDKVEISYYVGELYDAKVGKFVNYNIVSYIQAK
ncbi:hypothetical protein MG290_05030 [Flavobacterium sp. CBA20B-1]|uniref:hypothetical protein n=1 Tax=unclassified Flavobacterium TaxID=196869 RepID=UPI00222499A8|nr:MULTISPECIES: hypothetical protein [unclassified Flavobacterium]WCM43038.1 hypothetical protein MG290_05030 [Flavobacterium sp. CBA20B-1]